MSPLSSLIQPKADHYISSALDVTNREEYLQQANDFMPSHIFHLAAIQILRLAAETL